MPNLNHVTLLGNCTRDPEIRYTAAGTAICSIGMAINHAYGAGDDRRQETCFVDITCFGKLAEMATEHLAKGEPVFVDGRLQFQTWEGQDGQKRSKHVVIANTIQWFTGSGDEHPPQDSTPLPVAKPAAHKPVSGTTPPRQQAPSVSSNQATKTGTGSGAVPETDYDTDDIPF